MTRIEPTAEQREFIGARIDSFEAEAPAILQWQSGYVRTHRALPLYLGWTETIGIRADGTLVSWSTEGEWEGTRVVDSRLWVNTALVEGVKRYPQLHGLIPSKPSSAVTCNACGGKGTIDGLREELRDIICECGGIGWIDNDDAG